MNHARSKFGAVRKKKTASQTKLLKPNGQSAARKKAEPLELIKAERTRALEALREVQALYSSLVDQMPAGVFRKDARGRFVFVNSWFCRLKKMRPEELLNKTPRQLADYELAVHDGMETESSREARLAAQGANHHELIMRTGQTIEVDEEYPGEDGKPRYLHVVKTPVFDAERKIVGSQGILFDVTQNRRAETELANERHLLRALLDYSPDSIYFKDRESRFVRCSRNMAKLFGVSNSEQMVGKSDFDFFTSEHARSAYEDEQSILRTGETLIKTEKETWPDGHVTWVLTSKMPLRNAAGEVVGTFGISKDVTATKEAEANLETAHRQLVDASRQAGMAEVATSVLHNVGNVLNSVNVSVALLKQALDRSRIDYVAKVATLISEHSADLVEFIQNDPKGKTLPGYLHNLGEALGQEKAQFRAELDSLVENIEHIKVIISMQQSFAKPAGVMEELEPKELMESALQINGPSLQRHGVELIREYAAVPKVPADRNKVLQILINLLTNARKALESNHRRNRTLRLSIRPGENSVQLLIADNGMGIAAENLTRIFAHGFTTRKDGHGFGLHSSALAAKEMGGSLNARSEGLGKGATFTLELPLKRESD